MEKGNIAVFITGWDQAVWKYLLEGIQNKAKEKDYSISVFNCAGSINTTRKFDVGEFQIFRLANLDMFDGVIVVANTIICKKVEKELFQTVKSHDIPAISLEIREDGLQYAGIDNNQAMRDMIEHLVVFHQHKHIGFVTGPNENQESMLRLKAYRDVLKEHHITLREEDIFYGTYEFESGLKAAEYFVSKKTELPTAIACANDEMAMGLMRGLQNHGLKIPQNIAVTGFDDIDKAVNFEPRLTSVMRPRREMGYQACDHLIRAIEGHDVESEYICQTAPVFRESCGCWMRGGKSYRAFRHEHFVGLEENLSNTAVLNEMTEMLMDCDTFEEMLSHLKQYISFLKCEGLYICLNPDVQGPSGKIDSPDFMGTLQKYENAGMVSYAKKMSVLVAYKDGQYFDAEPFETGQLFPKTEQDGQAKTYLLSPIHFQDRNLGYIIIVNPDLEMSGQPFYQWLMNINFAIENIRRKNAMNAALRRLEEMYIRDGLTNLYNRFGFDRYSNELYNLHQCEGRSLLILFADLNKLKHINDDYGHENGDIAIKAVANAIIHSKRETDVCFRFGGDEFILMGLDYHTKQAEDLICAIEGTLKTENEEHAYPYKISASMGYYIMEPGSQATLSEAIAIADQNMYQVKKQI